MANKTVDRSAADGPDVEMEKKKRRVKVNVKRK